MTEVQSGSNAPRSFDRSEPFYIRTTDVEKHWPAIEQIVRAAETWSQLVSARAIHDQLTDGRMFALGVLDRERQLGLAITQISTAPRGVICTAWIFLPMSIDDNAAVGALLGTVEGYACSKAATVLEVYAAPWFAPKIESLLAGARVTASVLELDLRSARNSGSAN